MKALNHFLKKIHVSPPVSLLIFCSMATCRFLSCLFFRSRDVGSVTRGCFFFRWVKRKKDHNWSPDSGAVDILQLSKSSPISLSPCAQRPIQTVHFDEGKKIKFNCCLLKCLSTTFFNFIFFILVCENIRIVVVSLFDVSKATICCFTTFRNNRSKIFLGDFFHWFFLSFTFCWWNLCSFKYTWACPDLATFFLHLQKVGWRWCKA